MKSDIEIAIGANMKHILDVAKDLGLTEEYIDQYGRYKGKLSLDILKEHGNKKGKLILVTAINPTPAGEGKSTTTIGLADGLKILNKKSIIAMREPSLGPVFGMKGGAAGGGYAQVVPMEDINLHFTGDMHAITSANNLLSAAIDNHIHHGNELNIDVRRITFKRVMDMNDRALRETIVALGGKINGFPREDGFNITVASEIMAILCLATSLEDLKNRMGNIIIGYNLSGELIYARDLKVDGAMALLMKDAIKPNLVQTLENTPAIIHGGPFANIAHGCNSILATKMAMNLSDYAITEAGFGADLGAEKFFDIKCRYGDIVPDCVVLVATVRAIKYNGGIDVKDLNEEDLEALQRGIENLKGHIENINKFGVPIVVAINKFSSDTEKELRFIEDVCKGLNVPVALSEVFDKGGEGGVLLAEKVIETLENKTSDFKVLYDTKLSIEEKIEKIAKEIYGASKVNILPKAKSMIKTIEQFGLHRLPICIAKNQYSFSDNPRLLGRPRGFEMTVREINISNGAGFIVVLTGDIMTMPGLPKVPAANKMNIDEEGNIVGLF